MENLERGPETQSRSKYRNGYPESMRINLFEPMADINNTSNADVVDADSLGALEPGYKGRIVQVPGGSDLVLESAFFEPTKRKQQIGRVMRNGSHEDFGEKHPGKMFVRPWMYLNSDFEKYRPYTEKPFSAKIEDYIERAAVDCSNLCSEMGHTDNRHCSLVMN